MSASPFLIREIEPDDNPELEAIIKSIFPEFGLPLIGTTYEDYETTHMYESYQGEGEFYYVVEVNGEVIGGAGIKPLRDEKPEFVGVDNLLIKDASSEVIYVSADAHFRNPNSIGGKLKTDGIKVFVNDVEMTTIVSEEFDVPAEDDFTIPLEAAIPSDSIFSNKSLGGLINSLFTESMKVRYKGEITYKILGFSYDYPIDTTDEVKIKL